MQTTKLREAEDVSRGKAGAGVSKLKLALGAAGLLLFIVGVRRSYRTEEAPTSAGTAERTPEAGSPPGARGRAGTGASPPSQAAISSAP